MYGLGAVCNQPLPPGMVWVDQSAACQWLSSSDAAKIGGLCWQGGIVPGRYKAGGNGSNTVLACENDPQTSLMFGGALALTGLLLLPSPYSWLAVAGGAGIAFFGGFGAGGL